MMMMKIICCFFYAIFFLNPLRFNYPDSKNKQSCPSSSAVKFTVKPTLTLEGCMVAVKADKKESIKTLFKDSVMFLVDQNWIVFLSDTQ